MMVSKKVTLTHNHPRTCLENVKCVVDDLEWQDEILCMLIVHNDLPVVERTCFTKAASGTALNKILATQRPEAVILNECDMSHPCQDSHFSRKSNGCQDC